LQDILNHENSVLQAEEQYAMNINFPPNFPKNLPIFSWSICSKVYMVQTPLSSHLPIWLKSNDNESDKKYMEISGVCVFRSVDLLYFTSLKVLRHCYIRRA